MTTSQTYLLEQIELGRTFKQFNYNMTSKIQFIDTMEVINIRTIQSLRKLGFSILIEINN
tara:strand:+ start:5674 stop:5853 length:180 start_codon:yes stop_codon:yes gene_type:complete